MKLINYGCIRNIHSGELSEEGHIEIQDVGVALLAIYNQIIDDFKQLPECHGGLSEQEPSVVITFATLSLTLSASTCRSA